MDQSENLPYEISEVIWCPSMPLYGIYSKQNSIFEVKRCQSEGQSDNQAVVQINSGDIEKFTFMDDKGLKTIVGYKDGSIDIINTDDGKELYKLKAGESPITAIEILEHHSGKKRKVISQTTKKSKKIGSEDIFNSAQKYLLPIEFNEATKSFKRKLKYLESFKDPNFLFVASQNGFLNIYLNSCFPIAEISLQNVLNTTEQTNSFGSNEIPKIQKMIVAKDLSKLFMD
jgi:WD40 repeat protein